MLCPSPCNGASRCAIPYPLAVELHARRYADRSVWWHAGSFCDIRNAMLEWRRGADGTPSSLTPALSTRARIRIEERSSARMHFRMSSETLVRSHVCSAEAWQCPSQNRAIRAMPPSQSIVVRSGERAAHHFPRRDSVTSLCPSRPSSPHHAPFRKRKSPPGRG